MSNVINAAVGGAASNSYVTLVEAEEYLTAKITNTDWNALNDEDKAGLLISAARQLDLLYWQGSVVDNTQALQWPRYGMVNNHGWPVLPTEIPKDLKAAQVELAYSLALGNFLLEPDTSATEFSRVAIGDLDVTYRDVPVTATSLPKIINKLLAPFLASAGNRVVRA